MLEQSYKCERCYYVWNPKSKIPVACPKCKSYNWKTKPRPYNSKTETKIRKENNETIIRKENNGKGVVLD